MRTSIAILLMAWSAAAAGQQLGTLFHTPKERELLERLRRGEKVEEVAFTRPDPTLTGFVKRSDGKSTVFLDKEPMPVTDPRLQGLLDPRNVLQFEPAPAPPPPPAAPAPSTQRQDSSPKAKTESPKGRPSTTSRRDVEK